MPNSRPLTIIQMLIPNSATVQAIVADPQASLILETRSGSMRVDVRFIDEPGRPQLTGRTRRL